MTTLYYVHDPMCSWCWGFKPALTRLISELHENITLVRVVGGLAPDSNVPMPESMQHMLQQTWHRIQDSIPGIEFNFDFWTANTPIRSTYPACRAVLAASAQNPDFEEPMINAIQHGYYVHALNPSLDDTLITLAEQVGCNSDEFTKALDSSATNHALTQQINLARSLGAQGFPSLILEKSNGGRNMIQVNYLSHTSMLEQIESYSAS